MGERSFVSSGCCSAALRVPSVDVTEPLERLLDTRRVLSVDEPSNKGNSNSLTGKQTITSLVLYKKRLFALRARKECLCSCHTLVCVRQQRPWHR